MDCNFYANVIKPDCITMKFIRYNLSPKIHHKKVNLKQHFKSKR